MDLPNSQSFSIKGQSKKVRSTTSARRLPSTRRHRRVASGLRSDCAGGLLGGAARGDRPQSPRGLRGADEGVATAPGFDAADWKGCGTNDLQDFASA